MEILSIISLECQSEFFKKEASAFATLGVLRLISFMGLLEHPNCLDEYQIRSRERPKQFELLRRGLETRILEKFVLFSGQSQKNLASYYSLFEEGMVSDNKQSVCRLWAEIEAHK